MPKLGKPSEPRNDIWWWDDYDDFRPFFRAGPLITDITVFEEDKDDVVEHSGLLAPDGSAIMVIHEHPGLDFIGFVNPEHYDRMREDAEKDRNKRAGKEKRRAAVK